MRDGATRPRNIAVPLNPKPSSGTEARSLPSASVMRTPTARMSSVRSQPAQASTVSCTTNLNSAPGRFNACST